MNPGMNGLLKEQPGSQLFTVFGRPRTKVSGSTYLHEVRGPGGQCGDHDVRLWKWAIEQAAHARRY